ncbi:MAG: ABC transporter substrate-binding protein [Rhodospirillaceae bacterium]|nr:ABC transporter substrate-binding protein [Rhodospirillaceae bacterium]
MARSLFMGLWLLGLGALTLGSSPGWTEELASPTSVVERVHATLIDNMKQGKALGFEGRRAKLEPVVKASFDLAAMARISTGGGWQKMSESERADVISAFTAWTVANYAGNFAAFDGEKFETKSQSPDDGKGNVMVNTQLTPKGVPPVLFNYRLHKADNAWKIFDIYLDGAISQLAMRRAEFAAVLARGTAAELAAHMRKLATDAEKGDAAK